MGLKRRLGLTAALLALAGSVCAARAVAAGSETFGASAQVSFFQAAAGAAPRFERLALPLPGALIAPPPLTPITLVSVGQAPAAAVPSQEIPLAPLLNRHLRTSLSYNLGGKSVWVSGGFDRAQNAYVGVVEEGKTPRFFNVEELAKRSEVLDIGTAKYKLSLSPDLSDLMESEIVLTNVANKKDQQRPTLREMLSAVAGAGENARIGGSSYKVFYYDDIGAASRSFAFILSDANGQFHVFLVPAELVPTDTIAIFKMHDSKPVGLQRAGPALRLFDNP